MATLKDFIVIFGRMPTASLSSGMFLTVIKETCGSNDWTQVSSMKSMSTAYWAISSIYAYTYIAYTVYMRAYIWIFFIYVCTITIHIKYIFYNKYLLSNYDTGPVLEKIIQVLSLKFLISVSTPSKNLCSTELVQE